MALADHIFNQLASSMRQPLSVIVPCKNESRNIGACIESFYSIADEIIIADSGSTDDTLKIAATYDKVRIIERDYRTSGDFKNWAIPQAAHTWVLIVDADERIKDDLADEIVSELTAGPKYDGYWIFRENYFLGHRLQYGDARRDGVIRFFHRDRGQYEGPSDHGEIAISTGSIGRLSSKMTHYSMWEYDQLFYKYRRYTTLQAQQWDEKGVDTSYFKLLVRPAFRFFREFILQGSILDGKAGLQTAWMAAFYSFSKQARLWERKHGIDQDALDPPVTLEQRKALAERNQSEKVRIAG